MRSRVRALTAVIAALALANSCASAPSGGHSFSVESPTTEPTTSVAPTTTTTLPPILDPPGAGVSFPPPSRRERDDMPASLNKLWTRSYTAAQVGTAADEKQVLLVAQNDASPGTSEVTVICLDRSTGDEQWVTTLPGSTADWTFTDKALILRLENAADSTVVALSRSTGKQLWSTPAGGTVLSSSLGDQDAILVVRDNSGRRRIRAISFADGSERWSTPLSDFVTLAFNFELTAEGLRFDWNDSAGKNHMAMVRAGTGEMVWDVAYPNGLGNIVRVGDFVYFTDTDGYYDYITQMQLFDVTTGAFGNRIVADSFEPYGDFVVGNTGDATTFYDPATLTPIREFAGKNVDDDTFETIGDFIVERTAHSINFYDRANLSPLGALPLNAEAWTLWNDILLSGAGNQLRATRISDGRELWSFDSPVVIDSVSVMNDLLLVEGERAIWAMRRVATGLETVWHLDDVSGRSWPLDDFLVLHLGDADLEYAFVDVATGEIMAKLADLWSEGPYSEYANGVMVDYWDNRTEFYLLPSWELGWTLDPGNWFHMDDAGTVQVDDDWETSVVVITAYN